MQTIYEDEHVRLVADPKQQVFPHNDEMVCAHVETKTKSLRGWRSSMEKIQSYFANRGVAAIFSPIEEDQKRFIKAVGYSTLETEDGPVGYLLTGG